MALIEETCQNCGQVKFTLHQCPQCKSVSYCSKNCERMHKNEHSKVCIAAQNTPDEYLKESSVDETENFCQTCFRTNVALQRCSRCKTIYYCSKLCQKIHWAAHQSDCKASKANCDEKTSYEYSNGESCKNENCVDEGEGNGDKAAKKKKAKKKKKKKNDNGSSNIVKDGASGKKDTGVRDEIDKDSDKDAAKNSSGNMNCKGEAGGTDSKKDASKKGNSKADIKTETVNNGNQDAGTSVTNNAGICDNCGNFYEQLKRCSQCKIAKYCSKSCQKSAWPLHKKLCTSSNNANTESSRIVGNFRRALAKAERSFPYHNIITKFYEVSTECQFYDFQENTLLVAFIISPGFHIFRPSYYIQDTDGCNYIMIFYHQESDPYPYFSWDQLKVGTYICILEPELHYFLDGRVGFRINSTEEVRVL
ncbi:Hypothetical predicted protein [Octopus vulgaris]|uniref:MYND-type domain-containing protein n=1 Tax=Octopus vulgaris TaxID=6645 RepID=A0AA36BM03_OCTVU|nr:Hypothetical predicted protein [Octopus vulgaris]